MAKKITRKYFIEVETASSSCMSKIQLSANEFWKQHKFLTETINEHNKQDDLQEYERFEIDEYSKEVPEQHYWTVTYVFRFDCTATYLTMIGCEDGYTFKSRK